MAKPGFSGPAVLILNISEDSLEISYHFFIFQDFKTPIILNVISPILISRFGHLKRTSQAKAEADLRGHRLPGCPQAGAYEHIAGRLDSSTQQYVLRRRQCRDEDSQAWTSSAKNLVSLGIRRPSIFSKISALPWVMSYSYAVWEHDEMLEKCNQTDTCHCLGVSFRQPTPFSKPLPNVTSTVLADSGTCGCSSSCQALPPSADCILLFKKLF